MPVTRVLTRFATITVAAAIVTVMTIAGLGSPATAARNGDCEVFLLNLSATIPAATPSSFSAKIGNDSPVTYPIVHREFLVELTGLVPGKVTMSRGGTPLTRSASGAGRVTFSDAAGVPIGARGTQTARQSWPYTITFTASAPSGTAKITFHAYDGTVLINSVAKLVTVTVTSSGAVPVTPGPTATPGPAPRATATGSAATRASANPTRTSHASPQSGATSGIGDADPTGSTNDSVSLAGGSTSPSPNGSSVFYAAGAALVAIGAIVAWLFRRRHTAR